MEIIVYLLFPTIILGFITIATLFWCINNNQYEDLPGAAKRILHDDDTLGANNHSNTYSNRKKRKPPIGGRL